MKTGLCSITFRQYSIQRIVEQVQRSGIDAIEWGGDVHVPAGDISAASDAKRMTVEAGVEVASYGSYYTVLDADGKRGDISPVIDSALALGTDTIRIWAGALASDVASETYRKSFIEKLRADLGAAARNGVRLALEFHAHTLSDTNAAALELLDEVNHPCLYTYWQPMYWVNDLDDRFQGLEKLRNRVLNLHVFHWRFHPERGEWAECIERRPLEEGATEWSRYLSVELPPGNHYALMEFVREDDPAQFLEDAKALHRIVQEYPFLNG